MQSKIIQNLITLCMLFTIQSSIYKNIHSQHLQNLHSLENIYIYVCTSWEGSCLCETWVPNKDVIKSWRGSLLGLLKLGVLLDAIKMEPYDTRVSHIVLWEGDGYLLFLGSSGLRRCTLIVQHCVYFYF